MKTASHNVSGAFFVFFLLTFVMLCENKRHFSLQECKDKHAKCRSGGVIFSQQKTFPKPTLTRPFGRVLRQGQWMTCAFRIPHGPRDLKCFQIMLSCNLLPLNFIESKHLLLPCNGALLWIILLGTPEFQNTQSKIQSPTFKTFGLHCRCWNFGIVDYWRFTEGIWDATS